MHFRRCAMFVFKLKVDLLSRSTNTWRKCTMCVFMCLILLNQTKSCVRQMEVKNWTFFIEKKLRNGVKCTLFWTGSLLWLNTKSSRGHKLHKKKKVI